jgi:hypothetical protein
MKKINYDEVRKAWLRHAEAEAKLWLQHLDVKRDSVISLQAANQLYMFEQAELLFHVFSFVNWMAHIDLRNSKTISEAEMVSWVQQATSWPVEIAEAFWYCLRNPVMHTGRTFIFSNYDRKSTSKLQLFADLHPNLTFDPKEFQPERYKPTEIEDGWLAVLDPEDQRHLMVTFYFPGVRRKLAAILGATMSGIVTCDNNALASLQKLNRKLLTFRVG